MFKNKTLLITGGTGSFGNAVLRRFLDLDIKEIRVFSRDELLERVWGKDYFGDGRLVDVQVRRLRKKIEPEDARPRYVVTVRGFGYKLKN